MEADTQTLYDSGDMTRVIVLAADQNGQTVPRAGNPVTISVTGPGEFLGESPVVMEDGKTAFFVKTGANQTGTITCRAESQGLTQATLTIDVVPSTERYDF
jgi:hypothetical protein